MQTGVITDPRLAVNLKTLTLVRSCRHHISSVPRKPMERAHPIINQHSTPNIQLRISSAKNRHPKLPAPNNHNKQCSANCKRNPFITNAPPFRTQRVNKNKPNHPVPLREHETLGRSTRPATISPTPWHTQDPTAPPRNRTRTAPPEAGARHSTAARV
jgi:hypothetical protein